ncbi:MAG TPA: hypothetical protein IAC35_06210 [Candidatus Cryptobacteroides merdipullorum]|uniref:Uncharacterized protein n=1 Tax=Candidatus Cryptobacteroides merdipullorum TaxID=2840771 RepID=A0A9D1GQL1_9BACT|nr:hypothetical protein [Candidatus Cryptobacteroides merdipullorum]
MALLYIAAMIPASSPVCRARFSMRSIQTIASSGSAISASSEYAAILSAADIAGRALPRLSLCAWLSAAPA